MNLYAKAYWSNNPIPVNQQINNPDFIINVPIGVIIGEGGDVKSVNGKIGVVVLDAADVRAPTLTYVNEQLETKANSIAVRQALTTKADLIDGVIPASQLPSFVDDVLEGTYVDPVTFNDLAGNPYIPEGGKIYVDVNLNTNYRWSGMLYVTTGGGVSLGETAATAYRGDRGKIAYDHAQSQGNPHNTTTSEITEGTNKYFTDLRVRNTVLSGLVKTDSSNVTNTDTVEVAVGKLAARSEAGSTTINWVPASTVGVAATGLDISLLEFAKINGMLFWRGYIKVNSTIVLNAPCFSITNNSYKIIRPLTTASKTFSGALSIFTGGSTSQNLRFMVTGNSVDVTSALTSIQAIEPATSINPNSEYFAVQNNFCFGRLVSP